MTSVPSKSTVLTQQSATPVSWSDYCMQLELAAGFRAPCLVFEPTLQLTCHALGLITTATTARVLRYLSLHTRDHACNETFASSLFSFRSVPRLVVSDCTPSLSTLDPWTQWASGCGYRTISFASKFAQAFHHGLSWCGPREQIFTCLPQQRDALRRHAL